MKKQNILTIEFWYSDKRSTQPMITTSWDKSDQASINLMQSSDFVFSREILKDKKLPQELKDMLSRFCKTFLREVEQANP